MASTKKTTSSTKAKTARKPKVEPEVIDNKTEAKTRFNKALDEAKAGAAAVKEEAKQRAGEYRGRAVATGETYREDAAQYAGQAKEKAAELAVEGKARASDAISGLGQIVSDNVDVIDEKLGPKYGDYARTASRSLQETAAKIDAKEVDELAEDAREMVRKSPGVAVGIAAVAGFMLARLFRGGRS